MKAGKAHREGERWPDGERGRDVCQGGFVNT